MRMKNILFKGRFNRLICAVVLLIFTVLFTAFNVAANDNTEGEFEYVLSDDLNYYIIVGIGTFEGKDIIIPSAYNNKPVEEIAARAFSSCLTMETLYVPETVERIGQYAFSSCSNLKDATIKCFDMELSSKWPSSATECYGYSMFHGCSSLENLYICDMEFAAQVRSIYNYICYYPLGYIFSTGEYSGSVPVSQPYYIGDRAKRAYKTFYFPSSLKSITLGSYDHESCKDVDHTRPFEGDWEFIDKIIIEDGIKIIPSQVFIGMKGLKNLVLPDSITVIDYMTTYDSKISKVYYRGTPSQWSQITINDYNEGITTAEIVFVKHTKTIISEDGNEFTIKPVNIESGKTVVLALYEDNGFVEMQTAIYEGEEITFTTDKEYTDVKVMVWDDLIKLSPVCEVEVVE